MVTFSYRGQRQQVLSARLALTLETESWNPGKECWVYGQNLGVLASLEILVDEDSGEDGAAAPDAHWRLEPLPEDLFQSQWDDSAPEFEAWFGNDAPELEDNQIRFSGRNPEGQVQLLWTSRCAGEVVEVAGWVDFAGLSVRVTEPEHAQQFLQRIWPSMDWKSITGQPGETVEFDSSFAVERRRWHPLTFLW